ncbi:kelch repeat-containing protein [Archangium minus]|uniref:kelch repeat-containing protein n=1 Tax=Archangium minus TaxID=83450 RepID=UPI0037BE94F7
MGPFLVDPDEPPARDEPLTREGFPIGFAPEEEVPRLAASELAVMAAASSDGGTIELEPNVIQGTARLTNQDPEILALLAADPWHVSGSSNNSSIAYVSATSTKPSGYIGQTSTIQFKSPSEYDFTLLVESSAGGDAGVVYNVSARRGAYTLPPARGVVVWPRETPPNPTQVKIEACIGAIQFDFGVDEKCETPSPAFLSASVRNVTVFRLPGQQRYATYLTGGESMNSTLYYSVRGKDGRIYALARPVTATAACDEVVHICTPISDDLRPPPQGNLTGPWEVIGETSTYRRSILATYLALPTITRSHVSTSPTSPLSDPSTWWTMSTAMDQGDWSLQSSGYLRRGREFTRFSTTLSPSTPAGPVTVIANQTTPVTKVVGGETRHAFVMRPAYFYGAVRLADPSIPLYPGSRSTLESLWFEADYDSNGDGIPNDPSIGNNGTFLRATVAGGYSYTAFPHKFDRIRGELASTYEQALPSPYDLPLTWNQENLNLRFWSQGASFNTRPGMYDESLFRYGSLSLVPSSHSALLGAGEQKLIDHEYCFNEVQLQYATTLGRLYNPWADVSGSFNGKDWRDLQSTYSVGGRFYGIPAIWGYTPLDSEFQSEGSVSMTLPQGSYTLKPGAYMKSDNGTVNTATFAPVSVTLGCGQRVKIVPPLAVSISSASGCATGPTIPISGVVKSKPAVVDRIWYRLNGGSEVTVCTNCGLDPSYAFTLPLKACHNTLEVFAYTLGMPEPAIGVASFVWDDPSDGPSCPGYCVNRPPVARCRGLTVPADSTCSGCASVDDGSYDPDENDTISCVQTPGCPYVRGSQKVTLTCTDKLGLSSSCEATVTVEDMTPPALVCPTETPVLECRDGSAVATYTPSATDNCGGVSTRCTPPSGASFPLGTTQATCTATDSAGNTASCAIPITVQDNELPTLSCPATTTAECVGGSARVTPPAATAADTCVLAEVSQPTEASFPLGSTPVTYTAKDTAGQQVQCTSAINVVDTQAPTLALNGPGVITLDVGSPYTEQGATASDVCAGDLTSRVRISGTVDTSTAGSYTVTYAVADGSGHEVTTARTVHVVADTGICPAATGRWVATSNLANISHLLHTATPLPSGKVLVVGGYTWATELYDPTSGTWTATGSAIATHRDHTTTLLPNGRVLVAGGDGSESGSFAELYDPDSGLWLPTGAMTSARRYHTATLLPSGKVLVTGGSNDGGITQASAELYDPVLGTWTLVSGMSTARAHHTATLLPDGKVLVVGGSGGSGTLLASAELYDPASGTWMAVGGMSTARVYHTATLLPGGQVLVTGGGSSLTLSNTTELYDPVSRSWTASASMGTARRYHTATVLQDGRVLVVGGYNPYSGILTSAELYDPRRRSWCPAGNLAVDRYSHTATLLPDGRVLVAAGVSNRNTASAELYVP